MFSQVSVCPWGVSASGPGGVCHTPGQTPRSFGQGKCHTEYNILTQSSDVLLEYSENRRIFRSK